MTNSANAEMHCHIDSFANKTCKDSQGNTGFERTHSSGNEQWTDDKGNMTYKDSSGQIRRKKDSLGNETCAK
ncbi:MAG: hypothetical protein IBX55_09035 [Methyloprofundus sp.]|nr:hypothetical protein [Methyloprofundus sp.]